MRIWHSIIVFGFVLVGCSVSQAGPTACPEHYFSGVAPDFYSEPLVQDAAELCYTAFGVVHSGVAAIPLFAAEHLTKERVFAAKGIDRVNRFRAEGRLPARHRSELYHYKGSGYDRGHLAPSKDMPTHEAMLESFTLANMVPQYPELNRETWVGIEATARALAVSYDEVYVVTGVSFLESTVLKRLGGRVIVPTSVFKAIYIPSQNAAAAWYAKNEAPGDELELMSIETLTSRVGFDPFPSVAPQVKAVAAGFPKPSRGYDRQIAAAMDPGMDYSVGYQPRENTTGASRQPEARVSLWEDVLSSAMEIASLVVSEIVRWMKSLI